MGNHPRASPGLNHELDVIEENPESAEQKQDLKDLGGQFHELMDEFTGLKVRENPLQPLRSRQMARTTAGDHLLLRGRQRCRLLWCTSFAGRPTASVACPRNSTGPAKLSSSATVGSKHHTTENCSRRGPEHQYDQLNCLSDLSLRSRGKSAFQNVIFFCLVLHLLCPPP